MSSIAASKPLVPYDNIRQCVADIRSTAYVTRQDANRATAEQLQRVDRFCSNRNWEGLTDLEHQADLEQALEIRLPATSRYAIGLPEPKRPSWAPRSTSSTMLAINWRQFAKTTSDVLAEHRRNALLSLTTEEYSVAARHFVWQLNYLRSFDGKNAAYRNVQTKFIASLLSHPESAPSDLARHFVSAVNANIFKQWSEKFYSDAIDLLNALSTNAGTPQRDSDDHIVGLKLYDCIAKQVAKHVDDPGEGFAERMSLARFVLDEAWSRAGEEMPERQPVERCSHAPEMSGEAASSVPSRPEEPVGSDTSFIETFKARVKPLEAGDIVGLPAEISDFVMLCDDTPALRSVYPDPNKTLLLHGPPGSGKTTIARYIASRVDATLFVIDAAKILDKYVGESAKNMTRVFEQASAYAKKFNRPSLLLMDEIDSVVRQRGVSSDSAECDRVVNALLSALDGPLSDERMSDVIVIGTTNLFNQVDKAFISRMGLVIETHAPTPEQRVEIVRVHLKNRHHSLTNDELREVADRLQCVPGRDLKNFINRAALKAASRHFANGGLASEQSTICAGDMISAIKEDK